MTFTPGKQSATAFQALQDQVTALIAGTGVKKIAMASQSATVNSTVLVSDTELTTAVTAGITYAIQGMVSYQASTTADFKYALAIPTGTLNLGIIKYSPTDVLELVTMSDITVTDNTNVAGGAGVGSTRHMNMFGSFVATASGNITLRFASGTAVGGESAVRRPGSWLIVSPAYG